MTEVESEMPLEELARENELTKRLVEQLGELAASLKEGRPADAPLVRDGVELLGQYRALHADRLDRDLQPEARRVAMPGCFEHLDHISNDHEHEQVSVRSLLDELEGGRLESAEGRRALGEKLERFAQSFYQDVAYEGDYPLSCLVATLPDDASARVEEKFRPSHAVLVALEARIERFLAETARMSASSADPSVGGTQASTKPIAPSRHDAEPSQECPSCCGPVPASLQ